MFYPRIAKINDGIKTLPGSIQKLFCGGKRRKFGCLQVVVIHQVDSSVVDTREPQVCSTLRECVTVFLTIPMTGCAISSVHEGFESCGHCINRFGGETRRIFFDEQIVAGK